MKLHDALQAKGIRCWLDEHEVRVGDDILEEVNRGIKLWDKVLLLCSTDSLKSRWVAREVTRAFEKEDKLEKERGKRTLAIIPVDLDGFLFDGVNGHGHAGADFSPRAALCRRPTDVAGAERQRGGQHHAHTDAWQVEVVRRRKHR